MSAQPQDVDPFQRIADTSATRRAFGARVRLRRSETELNQMDLAETAQCTVHQVRDAEAGACYLPGVLRRIAEVLSIQTREVVP